ncbi:MAG TPA: glycogen debranching protein GlgX [Candidatus Anaerostipes avistercoris]|uniref:Glycogen debranching protein GlgX n=1 Tax=Candidatus Anaerostipes avistercoris TaxID=2838462 RepID=A0A9D2PKD4_9FIRM|nr:glycogen debranching protein GlgX [uncultured Anaerostipes sp.]HJC50859.1 glycogen debranching protein GlgX [Candidatus Anaerostipes avistercoris]
MSVMKENSQLIPVDEYDGFRIRPGFFLENGAVAIPGGVSFTVQTQGGTGCELVLFEREAREPYAVIPFPKEYRIGHVYSMIVFDLDITEFEYAYRIDGPYNPEKGLLFDKNRLLLDPYAKAVTGQSEWGVHPNYGFAYRARVVAPDFDWGEAKKEPIPMEDLVIYELHTRGFTKDESSGVCYPGTFEGIKEKIPYLKELGVNAVELMPIFEFDETKENRTVNGKKLLDYWGYNPVGFFAPNTSYASEKEYNREGDELKSLVKLLHDEGMEIILDVVFNHTAEGNQDGPVISLKGFDNNVYYMLTADGQYYNFSGCGNTLNCNHPVVQNMILDCLRYWVIEYRIDGFRFDLASILGRSEDGTPLSKPPLLERLAFDPILGQVKLIAEAWDAGGLYQVGSFPSWNRWSEWNGKYRDDMRKFLKGDAGMIPAVMERMTGSRDLYDPSLRGYEASVNFITCHDGFTLWDLYSYNEKHNEDNGWNNTDGDNNNNSWNCGEEGETQREDVFRLRKKLVKNALSVLMLSKGVPMILSGDEFCNTQFGNNNSYCQDNIISWLDWNRLEEYQDIFRHFKKMIHFRKEKNVLKKNTKAAFNGLPAVSYHGIRPWQADQEPEARMLGIMFAGRNKEETEDEVIYIGMNMHWEPCTVQLPDPMEGCCWSIVSNTAWNPDVLVYDRNKIWMEERSVVVLEIIKE